MADLGNELKDMALRGAGTAATTGNPWLSVISAVLPSMIGWFGSSGDRKLNREATTKQMELGQAMVQMLQAQQKQDMPFRGSLYNALRQRSTQQFPTFMPGSTPPPAYNPYGNRQSVMPTASQFRGGQPSGTMQVQMNPALQKLRQMLSGGGYVDTGGR